MELIHYSSYPRQQAWKKLKSIWIYYFLTRNQIAVVLLLISSMTTFKEGLNALFFTHATGLAVMFFVRNLKKWLVSVHELQWPVLSTNYRVTNYRLTLSLSLELLFILFQSSSQFNLFFFPFFPNSSTIHTFSKKKIWRPCKVSHLQQYHDWLRGMSSKTSG